MFDPMIRPVMMDACVLPVPMQWLLDVLPWICGVLLVSLAAGFVILPQPLRRRQLLEGDPPRITAAVTSAGPPR
ncbi:hypothetical protein AB0C87_09190 [Actinomadura sp. NPDC048021]|uniref:hypothetical protein n=1 Tax=Actinomadura sp. NPDC048021 TaxID=3155385 RepID=UPI003405BC8A